ncbi:MAG TPA: glycosyltransferase family 87 protein [Candidatus Limnocylindrales bacterium]|jgi:hypothetical protein|nr:glycosyltransferase family 87 protein [Candidatus Limnocylindrales bacterium]
MTARVVRFAHLVPDRTWSIGRWAIPFGVLIATWPIPYKQVDGSLDESWLVALQLAAERGMRHGVDIVFTYGPLGFLGWPMPHVGFTSSMAMLASGAIYLALITTMLIQARRIVPGFAAVLVTVLVARIFVFVPPFEALQILMFLIGVELLSRRVTLPLATSAALLGIVAGAAVLGKLNIGIVVLLLGGVAVAFLARPWWRGLAIYGLSASLTAAVAWFLTGHRLSDVMPFVTGSYEIIAGYNAAMGSDPVPERRWILFALAGAAGLVGWAAWRSSRDWPRRERFGLALLGMIYAFELWKTAIVRDHASVAVASALVALFAFAPRLDRQVWIASLVGIGLAYAGASGIQPHEYADVTASARALYLETRDAIVPSRSQQATDRNRARLRALLKVDDRALAAIGDWTVHIDPHFTSVVFAYPELRWDPLPIFQSYSAWTSELDRRNAEMLRSPEAPERILRSFRAAPLTDRTRRLIGRPFRPGESLPSVVDGRFRWFESPAATLEIFCRYRETTASDRWQVLARTNGSCGPPEPLASVTARTGQVVPVPSAPSTDRFVLVKIHGLQPSPLGRIAAVLYKSPDSYVRLGDTRYRLVADTADDGLILAIPTAAEGSGPFAFGTPIPTISVTTVGAAGAPLTFEFQTVRLQQP